MFWWLFLSQKVRLCNLSITHDYLFPSLYFNVSRTSGNSNSNLASVTSNLSLGLRQFECTAAQSLRFCPNMILRVFLLINFNIITQNYCLNKSTLILFVAFLLSVSIYMSRVMRKPMFCISVKTKSQISFAVTAKLISDFVFAT